MMRLLMFERRWNFTAECRGSRYAARNQSPEQWGKSTQCSRNGSRVSLWITSANTARAGVARVTSKTGIKVSEASRFWVFEVSVASHFFAFG